MRIEAMANLVLGCFGFAGALVALVVTALPGYIFGAILVQIISETWPDSAVPLQGKTIKVGLGIAFVLAVFRAYIHHLKAVEDVRRPSVEYLPGRKVPFVLWRESRGTVLSGDVFGMISELFYTGPSLIRFSLLSWRKAFRQLTLDVPRCARILEVVAVRGHRVSFEELEQIVPDANRFHVFQQLKDIDGVVFLIRQPAGVSLIEDLRRQLRSMGYEKAKEKPRVKIHPPPPPPEPLSPIEASFKLLGVDATASLAEIKSAYRRKIKECHPDRFARFGKDWQLLAEERSKQLINAYETVLVEREPPS